jgi:hypothetical protein
MAAKSRMKFGDQVTANQVINVALVDGIQMDEKFPTEAEETWPRAFSELSKGDMFVLADPNTPQHFYMKVHDYRQMPMAVNLDTGQLYSLEVGEPVLKVYSLNLTAYE